MEELVSVIIPVYKVEKYLERCVESVQKQTFQNLEIILVDDGSPDLCGAMCDEMAKTDPRIKVIHKNNGGLSDARNVGIEMASGNYIVFVDSDDWLDLDMIALLYRVLKKYNADIAECSYRNICTDRIEEETNCSAKVVEGDRILALEAMLGWRWFKPVAWNKLYKRDVLGDIRYPKGKLHEDEYTTYKYFYNANKLVYVDVSKYNYDRRREDSITGKKFREDNLDACWAFRERMEFFYKNNLAELYLKMNNIYCWYVLESLHKCYLNNISGEKLKLLLKQVKKDVVFLSDKEVNEEYLNAFKLISEKGLKKYEKTYRKQNEKG